MALQSRIPAAVYMRVLRIYHLYILACIWLIIQIVLATHHGVKIVFDSHRYLFHARELATNNHLIADRNVLYLGYTALLAFFFKLHFATQAVVVFQSLLSGLAACSLYKLTHYISSSWLAATLATLAYICWPDIQAWNFYIHTDSLFCSVLVIYSYLLLATRSRQRLLALPLFAWLLFIRPHGIIVGIATFIYWISNLYFNNRTHFKRVITTSSILFIIIAGLGFNKILQNIFPLVGIYRGGSLFGGHTFMAVTSATPLYVPVATDPPWQQLLLFIWHNPAYFIKLFALKFIVFFAQIKPYYSSFHNIAIILFIYPIYGLASMAFRKSPVTVPQRLFFLTLIIIQATSVALTLPDWDNRFIVPVLPFIFLLAAVAFVARFSVRKASNESNGY
ncbi:hypothetical protein DNI29_08580 [Hymenobacter sediminis]|nr:hypothetical protein DNI29_08580 [Hymenobacter sediminis]